MYKYEMGLDVIRQLQVTRASGLDRQMGGRIGVGLLGRTVIISCHLMLNSEVDINGLTIWG